MKKFFDRIGTSEIRNLLAMTITICCFLLLYFFLIKEIPVNNKDLLNIAAGIILGTLKDVTGYFFGASKQDSDTPKTKE